jgi:hypothetical protein
MDALEDVSERDLADQLINASTVRNTYCLGRVALEDARLLDRRGEHLASSVKYGFAADTFQAVVDAMDNDRDRQEITPIIELSKAWQLMTHAEAEGSPNLYAQASQRFERVEAHTTDERARVLAAGHSLFCQALEAGTRFERTRDETTYERATKFIVAAENYYVKAGFHTASAYARATHRLLDAYWYLYQAGAERNPKKKSQYYQLAAKLLQASIDSYSQASHPEKTEQVQRLLNKVLEEQTLSMALSEILHTPRIILSTESFVTPSQTYEQAVGAERFESAHVEAYLTVPASGTVDEVIEWHLDLVNVGKTMALLIRIDDLLPDVWTILTTPTHYTVEEGTLNLKGRSLNSMKSESIILRVQAHKPGTFTVNPRIIYVDDIGTFKSCTPESVAVDIHPLSIFEFQMKASKSVFDFLLQAFLEDYMRKRLSLETSGWRSRMEIVKSARVPKSSVYGGRGRSGQAIAALERRGLVETRIFPGERGRGGRIRRVRIAYERETIKRYIDQHVMNKSEKSEK